MNAAARAAVGCMSSVSARKRARRAAGLRRYESEIRLYRGKCRAPGCASRWGVTRVSIDLATSRERVDRIAHVECAQCGRTWYRVAPPEVTRDGYQSVLLTLIVPSGERLVVFASHGGVHSNGADESLVIVNATFAQLDSAYRSWRKRNDALLAARARVKARKAEADAAATRELMGRLAAMDVRRAAIEDERIAEERAAEERERKGLS